MPSMGTAVVMEKEERNNQHPNGCVSAGCRFTSHCLSCIQAYIGQVDRLAAEAKMVH